MRLAEELAALYLARPKPVEAKAPQESKAVKPNSSDEAPMRDRSGVRSS